MKSPEINKIVKEIRQKITNNIPVNDQDYEDFKKEYPMLYKTSMAKDFEQRQLDFFLMKLKQIEDNKTSEHDASVSVGSLLVDKYVKPNIKE